MKQTGVGVLLILSLNLISCSNNGFSTGVDLQKSEFSSTSSIDTLASSSSTSKFKILSISPLILPEAGGTLVTLSGTGFTSGISISIANSPCVSVSVINDSTLTCVTSPMAVGPRNIEATAPGRIGEVTLSQPPTVQPTPDAPPATQPPPPPPNAECAAGFTLFNNVCYADTKNCTIANGNGSQSFSNGIYSACMVASCNEGFSPSADKFSCSAIVNFPSYYLTACPPVIPAGQATLVSLGGNNLSSFQVFDGTKKVFEIKSINNGISTNFTLSPEATTIYRVVGVGPNGTKTTNLTITVLSPTDPLFKKGNMTLKGTQIAPVPGQSNGAPFAQMLDWSTTTTIDNRVVMTAKTATGTTIVNSAYQVNSGSMRHFSMVPTTYTVMSCTGSFFTPVISEITSVDVVPPKPPLNPTPGVAAECNGIYEYRTAAGEKRINRLETGMGNANGTGPGTNLSSCVAFFAEQQSLCVQNYGNSCQVYGYLQAQEPSLGNTMVTYRVFPAPTSPRTSAGVCHPTYSSTISQNPEVSSGPQMISSTNAESLIADCNNIVYKDFLEINTIHFENTGVQNFVSGILSVKLIDVYANSALINYQAP